MREFSQAMAFVCSLAVLAIACGGGEPLPSEPPPSSGVGGRTLAWDQHAPTADELRQYSFALYVDGNLVLLPGTTCGSLAGDGPTAPCSSPLPAIQPGTHTLEMVTRITREGIMIESARSAPIVVAISSAASASSVAEGARAPETQGPVDSPYVVESVVRGLDRPSALAKLPDGRLLVAERGGRIRVADNGALLEAPALELPDSALGGESDMDLAVAPDFAATRHVFVSYVTRDPEGRRIGRVVRFRETGGMLGESAVILDDLPAQAGPPRVRLGPDGALYVATAASDPSDADDAGSYAGKILRFTTSGATPADNPIPSSPVYSQGHCGRPDFDWGPSNNDLWRIEIDQGGAWLGRQDSGRRGEPVAYLARIQAVDVAFHSGAAPAAWHDNLFLASPDDESLYMVSGLALSPPEPVIERVFAGGFGRIVALLSADDGLYFATGNGGTDASGRAADAVFRVRDRTAVR